jgi:hypothetical protein
MTDTDAALQSSFNNRRNNIPSIKILIFDLSLVSHF